MIDVELTATVLGSCRPFSRNQENLSEPEIEWWAFNLKHEYIHPYPCFIAYGLGVLLDDIDVLLLLKELE